MQPTTHILRCVVYCNGTTICVLLPFKLFCLVVCLFGFINIVLLNSWTRSHSLLCCQPKLDIKDQLLVTGNAASISQSTAPLPGYLTVRRVLCCVTDHEWPRRSSSGALQFTVSHSPRETVRHSIFPCTPRLREIFGLPTDSPQ